MYLSKIGIYIKEVKMIRDFFNENGNILSRIDFSKRFYIPYIPLMLCNIKILDIFNY